MGRGEVEANGIGRAKETYWIPYSIVPDFPNPKAIARARHTQYGLHKPLHSEASTAAGTTDHHQQQQKQ